MASVAQQRRQFLKAMGGAATAAPFFSLLESSAVQGQEATAPMRLILLYSSFGGDWTYLRPKDVDSSGNASETALTPEQLIFENSVLEPLSEFASQMLVLEGLAMTEGLMPRDEDDRVNTRTHYVGHDHTAHNAFTGATWKDGDLPIGPSVDHVLGQQLGGETAVRALQMGIRAYGGSTYVDCISFNDSGQRLPAVEEAQASFRQLFGDIASGPQDDGAVSRASQNDSAVVDALHRSAERLRGRLAGPERAKLDEHLAALADVENRLAASSRAARPISCGEPSPPTTDGTDLPEVTDLQFDVLAQGLACDRTRFVAGTWATAVNQMPFLHGTAVDDLHNQVAHVMGDDGPLGEAAGLQMGQVNNWYASKIAALMRKLQSVPEGEGTLLDNTLIVWAQDFGQQVHGGLNVPYILLGGAQNKFRMGRHINYRHSHDPTDASDAAAIDASTYTPNNQLFVSLLNAFGLDVDSFNSTVDKGPLPGLV